MTSRLTQLSDAGQAIWLDFVDREFLAGGGLRKLIAEDGVPGVTSNPSIFEKAIGHGQAYDRDISAYLSNADASPREIYEIQAFADIRRAAADLRPTYEQLGGKDGYVSLEVSPYLASDTEATLQEARRLWSAVGQPNLMIKVPGTPAGVPAIRALVEEGVNINVTLLFSLAAYQSVAEAYLAGLEAQIKNGEPIDRIASVASFFVSRIDTQVDRAIDERLKTGDAEGDALRAIRGKIAIANAKLAYAWYEEMIAGERWRALADQGAMPQRLLWASTGVKDPAYSDTLYIDALIGPDTVTTMPPNTMDAFRDHGAVHQTLAEGLDDARWVLGEADRLGLKLGEVTTGLVEAGVWLFADAADLLLGAVAVKRATFLGARQNGMTEALPEELRQAVELRLERARTDGWMRRLWRGDATLWTGHDEAQWLGWLTAARGEQVGSDALRTLSAKARGYRHAVLLGMGGSSLGPEVLSLILGSAGDHPILHVLDTTDPGQIAAVAAAIDPARTLFIVSSKSGSTMEPELLRAYFWDLSGKDGSRFVAVTDPGSKLETAARRDGFAAIFLGNPAVGGRYSVMSAFGTVPAAAMGLDIDGFYAAAAPMLLACGEDVPPAHNPGARLGVIIGEAALVGRNKLTILPSPGLEPFGAWLEQLLAESTGKQGKGVVPIDLEPIGSAESYGRDRLFIHLGLTGDKDQVLEARLGELVAAGHPLVSIRVGAPQLLGQEFFRWEVATAIAGAVIGINPFDQPDVEDAKVATRNLVAAFEATGALDPETPIAENDDFAVYASAAAPVPPVSAVELLRRHWDGLAPGEYAGFLAYIERNFVNSRALTMMRESIRGAKRVATVAGFGPRFLHSTGQVYKGGPFGGVFLVINRDPDPDLAVAGSRASFGTIQIAQARGDMAVLAGRGRRVLRVHLKQSGGGIEALRAEVVAAARQI